jgi:hypothetical protein
LADGVEKGFDSIVVLFDVAFDSHAPQWVAALT